MPDENQKAPLTIDGKKCILCDKEITESSLFLRLPVFSENEYRGVMGIQNEDVFVEKRCLEKLGRVFRELQEKE